MIRYKNQLEKLLNLKDGWLDGDGLAPDKEGLEWLITLLETYPSDMSTFYIYPTPSGDVQLEWSISSYEIELIVNLIDHTAEWYTLNMITNKEEITQANLDTDWEYVIKSLRYYENI